MVQICFRVPSDVADFIRDMSLRNDRQPGAELARMIRPIIEVERKRLAWEEQQQAKARQQEADERQQKSARAKKGAKEAPASEREAAPDLFGLVDPAP